MARPKRFRLKLAAAVALVTIAVLATPTVAAEGEEEAMHPCPMDDAELGIVVCREQVADLDIWCAYTYEDENDSGHFDHGEETFRACAVLPERDSVTLS